jgi:alpha-tubulin suppressor-like RCC1 family protein
MNTSLTASASTLVFLLLVSGTGYPSDSPISKILPVPIQVTEAGSTTATTTTPTPPPKVDLIITEVDGPAGGVGPGASVDITTTVVNTGKDPTKKFLAGFYLSTDKTITTADTFIGRFKPTMGANEQRRVRITLTIPAAQEFGKYYLGGIADYTNAIPETNEENNTFLGKTISITPADLIVTKMGSETTRVNTDAVIAITNTVSNKGTAATGSFKVGFYLSLDVKATSTATSTDIFLGERFVASLAVGEVSEATTSVDIPNLATGSYRLRVMADYANAVREGDEKNNSRTMEEPLEVTFVPAEATSVASGLVHSCAAFKSGRVKCWGDNSLSQAGSLSADTTTPVTVGGITTALSLTAGLYHTCAILFGGTVQCWGYNGFGQLGDKTKGSSMTTPVTVNGIADATAIAGGFYHSCAVLAKGTVQCWGHNDRGQLGNGTTQDSAIPVTVDGITTATAISAGFSHTCAVLSTGGVQCWGDNAKGQLGGEPAPDAKPMVTVKGITTATSVSLGDAHSCVLQSDGQIKCWGYNGRGQLGDGTTTSTTTPITVGGINTAKSIDAGHNHVCATLSDNTVKCWGSNSKGQLGNGTFSAYLAPVAVEGMDRVRSISTNDAHTCAAQDQGTIHCWGFNGMGQLGNGTKIDSATPIAVLGITAPVLAALRESAAPASP